MAFVAGMAAGVFSDWSEIGGFLEGAARNSPDTARAGQYDEAYATYRDLCASVRPLYSRLRPLWD